MTLADANILDDDAVDELVNANISQTERERENKERASGKGFMNDYSGIDDDEFEEPAMMHSPVVPVNGRCPDCNAKLAWCMCTKKRGFQANIVGVKSAGFEKLQNKEVAAYVCPWLLI